MIKICEVCGMIDSTTIANFDEITAKDYIKVVCKKCQDELSFYSNHWEE